MYNACALKVCFCVMFVLLKLHEQCHCLLGKLHLYGGLSFVDSVVGSVLAGERKILRINFLLMSTFQDTSWCGIQSLPAYSLV